MTDQSLAAMSSADQLPTTIAPAAANSSTPNAESSNWDRWLRGQSWLESGIQNTGNANSSAHGYFQFLAGTADKAVKAGLPDPRIGSYDQQAAATQAYIQKFYPDAARAIEGGQYGEAAKLLNKEWPSLPGGSQPQDFGRYLQWSGMLGGKTPGQMEYEKALGYDPATGAVQPGGIYDLTRQKWEAEENAEQRALDVQQANIGAMDRAWRREAAAPDDLQPWDAKAEQQKYSVTPTEAALNPGFWLAIFASAFTHTPMINALNGAAASINALKDGKDEEYKRAYAAWQANANLAIHRHELMHQDYEDAIQLYDRDFNLARSQALMVAAKYDDKLALSYLQNGLDDKFIGLIDNRDVKFTQFAQANAALTQYGLREDVYNGMLKQIAAYQQKNNLADDAPPIVALKLRAQAVLGAKSPMDEATAQAAFQFQMQNPNATPLQIMQFYTGMSAMNPATLEKNQANPKWWASPQGQALKKTLPPAEQQKVDAFVQQYGGAMDVPQGGTPPPGMTQQEFDINADLYRTTGQLPQLGWGASMNAIKMAIINHANDRAAANVPILPAAESLAAQRAGYQGQVSGARSVGTRGANIEMASNLAAVAIPQALKASDEFSRTSWTPVNLAKIKAYEAGSNVALSRWDIANLQIIEMYARALNPTGNTIRADMFDRAASVISQAKSPEAYRATLQSIYEAVQREHEGIRITQEQQAGKNPAVNNPFGGDSQDSEALQWANSHPNDPRAAEIKRELGVQ